MRKIVPKVKLPIDIPVTTKEKLLEIVKEKKSTQTAEVIRLIEEEHKKIFGDMGDK